MTITGPAEYIGTAMSEITLNSKTSSTTFAPIAYSLLTGRNLKRILDLQDEVVKVAAKVGGEHPAKRGETVHSAGSEYTKASHYLTFSVTAKWGGFVTIGIAISGRRPGVEWKSSRVSRSSVRVLTQFVSLTGYSTSKREYRGIAGAFRALRML